MRQVVYKGASLRSNVHFWGKHSRIAYKGCEVKFTIVTERFYFECVDKTVTWCDLVCEWSWQVQGVHWLHAWQLAPTTNMFEPSHRNVIHTKHIDEPITLPLSICMEFALYNVQTKLQSCVLKANYTRQPSVRFRNTSTPACVYCRLRGGLETIYPLNWSAYCQTASWYPLTNSATSCGRRANQLRGRRRQLYVYIYRLPVWNTAHDFARNSSRRRRWYCQVWPQQIADKVVGRVCAPVHNDDAAGSLSSQARWVIWVTCPPADRDDSLKQAASADSALHAYTVWGSRI